MTKNTALYFKENCSPGCNHDHGLLHLVCRHRPPLFIVEEIDGIIQNSLFEPDCTKRFPVHIAAMCGAPIDVIGYLARKSENITNALDSEGKSVLHHLFHDYAKKFSALKNEERGERLMYKLVSEICDIAPFTTLAEDKNDMNALEYALYEEVDLKIVKKVQKTSEKLNKRLQTMRFHQTACQARKGKLEESSKNIGPSRTRTTVSSTAA